MRLNIFYNTHSGYGALVRGHVGLCWPPVKLSARRGGWWLVCKEPVHLARKLWRRLCA